ncbi:MAG: glycosyltransferase family 4 protein, partial [Patescibacteria group bacterium]
KKHEVDVYASGDSLKKSEYNLIPIWETSIRTDTRFGTDAHMRESAKFLAYSQLAESLQNKPYDIIHNNCGWRFLLFAPFVKQPIVTTHHGPVSYDYQNLIFSQHKNKPYVSISNNQRRDFPDLNYVATIYNGIELDRYPFGDTHQKKDYMLFLARMSGEKGAIEAAKVAHALKKKLIVAAKVDMVDQKYFEEFKKYIDNTYVTFIGEVHYEAKIKLIQEAKCLLTPIQWEEPFGLMFTEAMAAGTPVVTFARGAAPEIIEDGHTGYLVNQSPEYNRGSWITKEYGIEGLSQAVNRMYALETDTYNAMCVAARTLVEKKFSSTSMVDGYETLFQNLIQAPTP